MAVALSGCGLQWPQWATVNSDPFAFMASEAPPPPTPPAPQNSPLSLQAKYDPMVNSNPIAMQEGGTLGSLGLNTDLYFDPELTDQEARINRLERAISAMHRDLKIMAPTLQKYASNPNAPAIPAPPPVMYTPPAAAVTSAPQIAPVLNRTINGAASSAPTSLYVAPGTANTALGIPQSASPVLQYRAALPPMPNGKHPGLHPAKMMPVYNQAAITAPQPVYTPPQASTAAAPTTTTNTPPPAPAATGAQAPVNRGPRPVTNGGSAIVSGVRVGDHPGKVRLVFDVTKKTNYTLDLDNNENLLIVELPNAKWKTPTASESFGKLPVLKSYKVDQANGGAGNIFIMQLKKPTQILMQGKYPALSGSGERIVIDLKK